MRLFPYRLRARARTLWTPLAAGTLAMLACSPAPPPAHPDAGWPDGALLSARRADLLRVLDAFQRLEHTPAAREAAALRSALPDCDELEAHAPEGVAGLRSALRCATPDGPGAGLRRHRGGDSLALAIPVGEGPRILLRAREQAGHLRIDLRWPDTAIDGLAASLLPGEGEAGAPVLTRAQRVMHARVRSDSLDLAALVPEGSQADQLFRLKSGLLAGALLDGTWELAVYPPDPRGRMPRVALALGVRLRSAAEAGLQQLLHELEQSWALRATPWSLRDARGVCLLGLKLLPELAPCAVATDRALVVGWNASSLHHALDAAEDPEAPLHTAARAELDLAAMQRVDRGLLASAVSADALPQGIMRWPWRRATARGERRGNAVSLRIELVPALGATGT